MKLKGVVRFVLAGGTAFLLLNIFCLVYYNLPVHITSKTNVTDYVWESHANFSKMTEGFGYGKMNNEGFNNIEDYTSQQVDVLVMGSSHMEAVNVPQSLSTPAIMNRLSEGRKYVYNIGISGHNMLHVVNNLETAVKFYKPSEYVVIETMSLQFGVQGLEESAGGKLKRIPSYESKVMSMLQKVPYLRLLYFQYKNFTGGDNEGETSGTQSPVNETIDSYSVALDAVMKKVRRIGSENNVNIIIFYHPHFSLQKDGSIAENTDYEYLQTFKKICADNGIAFISMADAFTDEYNKHHKLPHGFSNTAVGTGHLNRTGHRIIADELFRYINAADKEGST